MLKVRNKLTGVKEEAENERFESVNRVEVESRARELNEALSPEQKERCEYFCSEPKTEIPYLRTERLHE